LTEKRLRILIASSPRMGNTWLKSLLAYAYHVPPMDVPFEGPGLDPERVDFPDRDCVCHEHFYPHPKVLEAVRREKVHLITLLRHPADAFYSLYCYCNRRSGHYGSKAGMAPLVGVPFSHERVYQNMPRLMTHSILGRMVAWRDAGWADGQGPVEPGSGKAIPIRYEDLVLDTEPTLRRLTDRIQPVSREALLRAIDSCRIDRMQTMNDELAKLCRKGQANQWKDVFDERHLEIMRQFAEPMRELGYSLARPALEEREIASLRRRLAEAADELARKDAELAALRAREGGPPRTPDAPGPGQAADALNRTAD